MLIRRAREVDVDAITAIVHDAYAPYIPRIGRQPAPMLDDYRQVIAGYRVFVLEADGAVRGVLVLEHEGDVLHVQNVAVCNQARGQGLGRQLMGFAEDQARELGCVAIELYTNERMTENILFYPRLGYRETRRAVEDGYARVFFRKTISLES
ncbi:GNAT superfamily N-acetyltransferase [Pseudomonas sp. BIGb0408]|uniref:GNAT superfamily N-acetyltransferase n=1 Tax=Phytopseudomonas flavescens TaxID=29435 RepID=A0A7Y9XNE6_9GAMM|nr:MULTISPECIES: GNAT family N-acetyltransferase [Pseudomonas]MCW2290830.1 GNAT superfamily N-acetyltransferase [Pseudomonas sp. BIGb0408]NYH74598.1 GNAT superfamily N-acetyltransferase [Pseudomonas flavescens]